jgi:hypothetical protein
MQESAAPPVKKRRPRRTVADAKSVARPCVVCGEHHQVAVTVDVEEINDGQTKSGRHVIYLCEGCGFLHNPNNNKKDLNPTDHTAGRVGTEAKPGREVVLVSTATQFFNRPNLSCVVYGAGVSKDHKHIAFLPKIERVAVADLENYMGVDDFHNIRTRASAQAQTKWNIFGSKDRQQEQFDIVVASEVIEHFENPVEHFGNLLGFANRDGVVIAGTNFTIGYPVNRLIYPYFDGHVCMWSDGSIHEIARRYNFHAMIFGATFAGPRKRIIAFTRSDKMHEQLLWKHLKSPAFC